MWTGEGGIKAPASVEWLAVWGLDAHHHGAAAQLSGGCGALDNTQRSFHQDYQNIRKNKLGLSRVKLQLQVKVRSKLGRAKG